MQKSLLCSNLQKHIVNILYNCFFCIIMPKFSVLYSSEPYANNSAQLAKKNFAKIEPNFCKNAVPIFTMYRTRFFVGERSRCRHNANFLFRCVTLRVTLIRAEIQVSLVRANFFVWHLLCRQGQPRGVNKVCLLGCLVRFCIFGRDQSCGILSRRLRSPEVPGWLAAGFWGKWAFSEIMEHDK